VALLFAKKMGDLIPANSLKYLLHSHLSGPQPGRPLKNVHASSLTKPEGFCPRYYALHDVTQVKVGQEWLSTSESVTYGIGNDLQDSLVHTFADMGLAIGHWKCLACDKVQEFCKRPAKCPKCGCRGFKPQEVRFESAVSGASCGVDMLLSLKTPKLIPVEIKTMDKEQFKGLVAPLSEHRLRTNLYLRIIGESGHSWSNLVSSQKAKLLYTTKGGYGCADPELKKWGLSDQYSPFKEFDISRADAQTEEQTKRAKVVKDFREGKIEMPCGICSTATAQRAKSCSIRKICFSGDHPPKHEWRNA
jgi:hypothetical protein